MAYIISIGRNKGLLDALPEHIRLSNIRGSTSCFGLLAIYDAEKVI